MTDSCNRCNCSESQKKRTQGGKKFSDIRLAIVSRHGLDTQEEVEEKVSKGSDMEDGMVGVVCSGCLLCLIFELDLKFLNGRKE